VKRPFSLVESESSIFALPLVWCSQNLLDNLSVIPGKLAIASATRNPEIRAGLKPAPTCPLSRV